MCVPYEDLKCTYYIDTKEKEKMYFQQNSRPTMSTAASLLQEIERRREHGYPQSNLVSNVHFHMYMAGSMSGQDEANPVL